MSCTAALPLTTPILKPQGDDGGGYARAPRRRVGALRNDDVRDQEGSDLGDGDSLVGARVQRVVKRLQHPLSHGAPRVVAFGQGNSLRSLGRIPHK